MKLLKSTASSSRRITTIFSVIFCLLFVLVSPAFAEGAWVGGWDSLLNAESAVYRPIDLAVDSNETVYVVDDFFKTIMKKGIQDTQWSSLPNAPFQYGQDHPEEVVVGPSNTIYVLKGGRWNSGMVWKFDPSNNSWTDLTNSTLFDYPTGLAVDTAGNVYVSDMRDDTPNCGRCSRIRKLVNGTTSWTTIGDWNTSPGGQFQHKIMLTTDVNNYVYAVQAIDDIFGLRGLLHRLAPSTTAWVQYPSGDNQLFNLKVPNDIAVDRFGNLYVTDSNTKELHVFAKNATQWAQIRKDGNVKFVDISSVAVNNNGYVYVSDKGSSTTSPDKMIFRHQPWATQLVWDTQPTAKPALQTLSPSPVLSLKGPAGDLITGVSGIWTSLSLNGTAGATLAGTKSLMFNNGKATFADLYVDKAGTYTLTGLSTIASTNIVNAVWAFPNVDLSRVSSSFTITSPLAAPPTANPSSGATVPNNSAISLSTITPDAHFHYTTNGSTPTGSSPSGNQVTLTGANGSTVTVKAFTSATGFVDSDIATFTYTISWPKAVTPTANPSSGSIVPNNSAITLSTTTPDAHFHYTTNGSTPTGSSPSGNQVTLTGANGSIVTVKAIASASNFIDSDIAVFTYTIEHRLFLPVITR